MDNNSIFEGPLWRKILIFALPLAITSFLQQLFSSADVAVLGMYEDSSSIAAVGSTLPVINLSVNLLIGLSVGATVVISQLIGEGNNARVSDAVHTAMALSIVVGIFVLVVWELMGQPLLEAMGTPETIIIGAFAYFRVYCLSIPFLMVFNFCAAILRSVGDTRKPLLALMVSCAANMLLNICFIRLGWGIAGVAGATVLANILSCVIMIWFLMHYEGLLNFRFSSLCFHREIVSKIIRIGMPAAVQGMVFSISNIVIQAALNDLGEDVIAASTVALNFESWVYFLINAFGQACVAYNGLFYGARRFDKCKETTRWCLGLDQLFTNTVVVVLLFFSDFFLGLFTNDPIVQKLALQRLYIILGFDWISVFLEVCSSAMRGWGISTPPAVISIFGICVVRVIFVYTYFASHRTFGDLLLVYPLTWTITAIGVMSLYFYCRRKVLVA